MWNELQKEVILNLERDRNAYSLDYIKSCGLTPHDLVGKIHDSRGRVRDEVLKCWDKVQRIPVYGKLATPIPPRTTEIYFWGTCGSAKSSIISAILDVLSTTGRLYPKIGPGFPGVELLYYRLICFGNIPALLPVADPVGSTQWLPLLFRDNRGKDNNIAIIEVCGDVFEAASDIISDKPICSEEKNSLELAMTYLRDKRNPKYHFFVLDGQCPYEVKMHNLITYLNERKAFNNNTRGINLIVSKCEILSPDRNEWKYCVPEFAMKHYYASICILKEIIKQLRIDDRSSMLCPFSVGEVFFNKICLFDPEPAKAFIELMMELFQVSRKPFWKRKQRSREFKI